jgi:hemin uptake protein HemP
VTAILAHRLPLASVMNEPNLPPARDEPTSGSSSNNPAPTDSPRVITTEELFAGTRELLIQHGDQQYRLRITAAGKLILTK